MVDLTYWRMAEMTSKDGSSFKDPDISYSIQKPVVKKKAPRGRLLKFGGATLCIAGAVATCM